ncbi:MAG: outer membrane protein assembly factor BamB [Gammaproteobacteria bacterium]|nr:MAG: outer membrane protein assembly factor BamB [Gammaproteobacteria bacterium]
MIRAPRLLLMACVTVVAAGCSLFGGGDDEELPPAELLKFKQTLDVRKIWSAKLGKGSEFLRLALRPAGDGNRVYAASIDGVVSAFDAASGKRVWRRELELRLSAGPGVGEGLVVVAGSDGDLVALQASDGSDVWRIDIDGESLAAPLIHQPFVVAYTIDGSLRVYSIFDGSEAWSLEQALPALTLRGSASPVISGDTVMTGFDNGRLIAVDIATGAIEWEVMLSPPTGRSDLERLSDVDGAMAVVGQDLYAAGYQGRVAALAVESGQILWAREISTYVGVGADWNNVYVVGAEGELLALQRRNGGEVWRQEALLRRGPTAPVAFNTAVVVGDFDGYVHFFNNADGTPVARKRIGGGMVSGAPVVIGGRLYAQSESGTITAFAVRQPKSPGNAPDIAKDAADN